MSYRLETANVANEERRAFLRDSLQAYNRSVCPDMASDPVPLDIYLLDSKGEAQGGLVGVTRWGCLDIDDLALAPELRRQGIGTRVMRLAEAEARKRGCTRALLGTASFQARPFYEKLGYRLFAELPGFPPSASAYYLARELDAGGEERLAELPAGYGLVVADAPDEARKKRVDDILTEYNVSQNEAIRRAHESGHFNTPLDVYLLDGQGNVAGGLRASSVWHMVFLDQLWLPEGLRGQGWGRRLLEAAQADAGSRGCTEVQTRIHDFQTPGFWCRMGFRSIGGIDDYPPGHACNWMLKGL